MRNLIETKTVDRTILHHIFDLADNGCDPSESGVAACSFEGAGTRTRTTFLLALNESGLGYIELPVFLDTKEKPRDLAGYLDPFYDLYILRYGDHDRLSEFARYSTKPVINAMSNYEHPCEALSDAYWFERNVRSLEGAGIVLWGPETNVLRSWRHVAAAAGAKVYSVLSGLDVPADVDLVITDGWPRDSDSAQGAGLKISDLEKMGNPRLIATPPFTVGEELAFDPLHYAGFAGYAQKRCLLTVQKAVVKFLLNPSNRQGDASATQKGVDEKGC
jgi:hypothetical protein